MSIHQEQFRIAIDAFDGPLDLLLYLVRRAEVDIHDIPIAQIADEYLEVLKSGAGVDVEMAGEFLVMAATLIEIKSRSLVPPEQAAEDDQEHEDEAQEDPRGDLIRQLLSYQRFRTASELLEQRRISFGLRYEVEIGSHKLPKINEEPALELDDVHILDLSDAYEHIASAIDFSRLDGHHIAFDDVPIEVCQEELLERLQLSTLSQLTLSSTFEGLTAPERVGMFLATLELVRMRRVTITQSEHTSGEIILELLDEALALDFDVTSSRDEPSAEEH
ncbi:MAG: segregation/condensation protein A [Phycisphaerales bacterium]|nr:segregation/condensation protein A [Phycisphaerales bacterium]